MSAVAELLTAALRSLEQNTEAPTAEIVDSLCTYLALLQKWNQRINLVAKAAPEVLAQRHLIDSLAVLAHLPSTAHTLVDVGAGAGLPGVVIAIARPSVSVTALEPTHKKWSFLRTVRRELRLAHFDALPMRDDAYVRSAPATADVAVSRATWDPATWLQRGARLVGAQGWVLAMEGTPTALPAGARRHPYTVEDEHGRAAARAIVTWQPHVDRP